jgi:hypothetical protein
MNVRIKQIAWGPSVSMSTCGNEVAMLGSAMTRMFAESNMALEAIPGIKWAC